MNEDFFGPIFANKEQKIFNYFNGFDWKISNSTVTVKVLSPVDGSVLGNVQSLTEMEIDTILESASKAQIEWEAQPLHKRIIYLRFAADWIRKYQQDFIEQLVIEIGKSKEESKSEVLRTADLIDYYCQEVQSLHGEYINSDAFPGFEKGKLALVDRVAHGIVLAIAPFNYPINLAVSKIAPALLMGNSVIFKPPTQGSIVGLMLTKAIQQSGIPGGLIHCITGAGRQIGNYLSSHKAIQMIAFTGSTGVGTSIAQQAGMTPLLFECGGNNGAIVLQDADIEQCASELVKGAFSYAGQRCTAIKYVLATSDVMDVLLPRVLKKAEEIIKIGDPRQDETKLVGPLISEEAAIETEQAINSALSQGAELVMGGKRNGWYMEPSILKRVHAQMNIVAEEIFGPILSFITVSDVFEAINIINNSAYGLQASVFTKDEGTGIVVSQQLQVGSVQINGSAQRGPDHFPFTGIKASGVGVQGVRYSLEAMSRLKSIIINKPE